MGCPGQGCPWLRLNEVLGPGHSVTLPSDLHNPLLHQLYPPSPLDKVIQLCVLEHFVQDFMGASRDLRECSSSEVSCLLPRRYHIHWKNKPSFGLEYESSRQSSDGFHNPFSSDGVGWAAAVRAGENSALRQPPAPRWILSASPPQKERVLTPDTTRR